QLGCRRLDALLDLCHRELIAGGLVPVEIARHMVPGEADRLGLGLPVGTGCEFDALHGGCLPLLPVAAWRWGGGPRSGGGVLPARAIMGTQEPLRHGAEGAPRHLPIAARQGGDLKPYAGSLSGVVSLWP